MFPVGEPGPGDVAEALLLIEAPLLDEGAIDAVAKRAAETSAADVTVRVIGAVVQLNSDMGGFFPKGEFQYIVAQYVLGASVLEITISMAHVHK